MKAALVPLTIMMTASVKVQGEYLCLSCGRSFDGLSYKTLSVMSYLFNNIT